MYKSLAVLALFGTIAACAAPQTAPQSAAAENAGPAASSKGEATTRVCEEFEQESTGTRLGTEKVCKDVPASEKNPQTS